MEKRLATILSLVIIIVVVVSAFVVIDSFRPAVPVASKKPFYVGVTYCGDNVTEAEQLIDRVKDYTNLFVVQSGPLMDDGIDLDQICNYAVASGLNIIVYFANGVPAINVPSFIESAQASWGSHFLGLYYDDEPGGKMLDSITNLYIGNEMVTKQQSALAGQSLTINNISSNSTSNGTTTMTIWTSGPLAGQIMTSGYSSINGTVNGISDVLVTKTFNVHYYPNGTISNQPSMTTVYPNGTFVSVYSDLITYQPDGTVISGNETIMTFYPNGIHVGTYVIQRNIPVTDAGNISQFEPYQEIWNSRPLQNYAEAEQAFVNTINHNLSLIGNQSDVQLFTSDYGLYWFDYLGGYNTVFAELFGKKTDTQTLALVRGAADMQNKNWGVMIEWAGQSPIALQTGSQMYNEMKQAYEDGAEYAVAFNYSPDNNATGLLQNQQFAALQKFWKDIVQNPRVTNNVMGKDALVLPSDYGWGLRSQNDTIWGVWQADIESQQVWTAVHTSLDKYGSKLDIIYDDPAYPVADRYQHVYYWNQAI